MSKTNSTVKSKRASIKLGDIPLEVFMLPNGSYRLSQTQSTEAVDKPEISFRRFLESKSPEALSCKEFRPDKIAIEDNNVKINGLPIDVVVAYWTKEAVSGNVKAARLLGACAAESIERRADAAFKIQRTEEERQDKMQKRIHGKVIRRQLTDAIADYMNRHPKLTTNCCQSYTK